jgi:4-hydroxybenzoate polyprenyltransferase
LFNTSFWVYAKFLKKTVLLGNIFVSLSSAFMVPVMAWAVPYKLEMGMNTNQLIFSVVFASFAFLVSLAREVVKDWQDMEGDIKENAKTFPIVWGESKTILLTLVLLFKVVVLSSAIIYFHELFPNGKVFASYQLFFVAIPSIFISFKFINNTEELNPKDLSKWLKMLMMSGMVSMILF